MSDAQILLGPSEQGRWTIPMAIAWVSFRNLEIVEAVSPSRQASLTKWLADHRGDATGLPIELELPLRFRDQDPLEALKFVWRTVHEYYMDGNMSPDDARAAVENALFDERLIGRAEGDEVIPPQNWAFVSLSGNSAIANTKCVSTYELPTVLRADVVALWPSEDRRAEEQDIPASVAKREEKSSRARQKMRLRVRDDIIRATVRAGAKLHH